MKNSLILIAGIFLCCDQKSDHETELDTIFENRVTWVTPVPEPIDRGPLPKVCEPWKSGPEPGQLHVSENPSYEDIGLRSDRLVCTAYGDNIECESFGHLNAHWYEFKHLQTQPGGRGKCSEPSTNDQIECSINVLDQNDNIIETIVIICRGDRFCGVDKADQCCKVKNRGKVFIQAESYSEEEFQNAEEERCERLDERRKTCEPFCTDPKYSSQCANY